MASDTQPSDLLFAVMKVTVQIESRRMLVLVVNRRKDHRGGLMGMGIDPVTGQSTCNGEERIDSQEQ